MNAPAVHRRRSTCRACDAGSLETFLSLGPMPLANALLRSSEDFAEESFYPLDVAFCERCGLVQLVDVIDPEVLFREYVYLTGMSDTVVAHHARYAETVAQLLSLGPGDLVVEVASNDGSLLRCFEAHAVRTLGIEPATNVAAVARSRGVQTLDRFFDTATAAMVLAEHGPARAVIANNVLAHVDAAADFLTGGKTLLAKDGLLIAEVPYVRDLIDQLEYDTIYHEHLSYFSVSSLVHLCDSAGLSVVRIDHLPIHGGSLRMYAAPREHHGDHAASVHQWMAEERRAGLTTIARYLDFARDVAANRRRLVELLERQRHAGKTVAGYGAPAKATTLLNYCGIGVGLLPFTVDRNPWKVGRYTPGTHIPILPVSTLRERRPDLALILAWNVGAEIMQQQEAYRQLGGRFLLPIPEPRTISA